MLISLIADLINLYCFDLQGPGSYKEEHWHWRALQVDKAEIDRLKRLTRDDMPINIRPRLKNTNIRRVLINTWNSMLKNTIPIEKY